MLVEAFDWIKELVGQASVPQKVVDANGAEHWDRELHLHPQATPPTLPMRTLDGLLDYLKANKDGLKMEELSVQVVSEAGVTLWSKVEGPQKVRAMLANVALPRVDQFPFGKWLDQESFIIEAQTKMVDGPERARMLTLIASVQTNADRTAVDDGVTQTVATKVGVSLKASAAVSNPFTLSPFRTFSEIEQPQSPFILRVRQEAGQPPTLALFEADGGAWRLKAVADIGGYLEVKVPKGVAVFA